MHLGRYLPAKPIAILHRGHHRPHLGPLAMESLPGLPAPAALLLSLTLSSILLLAFHRRSAASLDFRRQTRCFGGFEKLRWRFRLRVRGLGLGRKRQAARHLRFPPTRLPHASSPLLSARLQAAAIEHHHRRPPRRFLVGPSQLPLAKLLHLVVADLGPLSSDPLAQSLQMRAADLHLGQFPKIVTRLGERRRLARLANSQGDHPRTEIFRAQTQSHVQRKKKTMRHFAQRQR